jgi:fatty-acyl-CoA synthase/long-chain acyl-CoA synthetase
MTAFQQWSEVAPVGDLLIRAAARYPERKALVLPHAELSYADLLDRSVAIARGLIGLGLEPRSHVGLMLNNGPEMVAAFFGIHLANCVAVPLNTRHKERELQYIIENADLRAILTSAADTSYLDFRDVLATALPSLPATMREGPLELEEAPLMRHAILLSGEVEPGFLGADRFTEAAHDITAEDVDARRAQTRVCDHAVIIYTSGTTANPKGCLLSHEAMTRGPVYRAQNRFRSGDHDVTWGGGPLFHIGSLAPFIGSVGCAGTYLTDIFFDPERALRLMEREGVTAAWPWFPAILQPLLDHPTFDPTKLDRLKSVLLIGPETLVERAMSLFPDTEFMQACGMTETAGIFALSDEDEARANRANCQGRPVPGVEVRIVDAETGRDMEAGAVGEILVRGYCVTSGYYRDPMKTAEALDEDGWLHTGDLYRRSAEGRLTFNGRVKDMLKVGGENVAAIEIESYLCSHPAVKIAEVVGKPDARLDEVPVAFVELRPGLNVTAEQLIDFCTGKIARYKVPHDVFFMASADWPMSATKVNKRALRELVG